MKRQESVIGDEVSVASGHVSISALLVEKAGSYPGVSFSASVSNKLLYMSDSLLLLFCGEVVGDIGIL